MKKIVFVLLMLSITGVYAAPAWHFGEITRIWRASDFFIVTFDTPDLLDCKHSYLYFKGSELGQDNLDSIYSMALSAFHTQHRVGAVIDKTLNGEYCHGISMDLRR